MGGGKLGVARLVPQLLDDPDVVPDGSGDREVVPDTGEEHGDTGRAQSRAAELEHDAGHGFRRRHLGEGDGHLVQASGAFGPSVRDRDRRDLVDEPLLERRRRRGLDAEGGRPHLLDELADVPLAKEPLLRWRLQREQSLGPAVLVDLVEGLEVRLAGIGGFGGEAQHEVGVIAPVVVGVHGLALDGLARVDEVVDDGLDELGEVRRHRLGRARRGTRGRQHELADEVVDVRLGADQQVGRDLAEGHGEPPLLGDRPRGVVGVVPRVEEVVAVELRTAAGLDGGPDLLAAFVQRRDAPGGREAADHRQAPPGHRGLRRHADDRRPALPVGHGDADAARAVARDAELAGPAAVQQRVRHELAGDELRRERDVRVELLYRPAHLAPRVGDLGGIFDVEQHGFRRAHGARSVLRGSSGLVARPPVGSLGR